MQFNSFERTKNENIIVFKNTIPMKDINLLINYNDNSNGSFLKKEFRWSYNYEYWSSWQTLNQGNFVNIQNNKYLYLEIKYTLVSINSGDVKFFIVNTN
jgi:hypothetical protein